MTCLSKSAIEQMALDELKALGWQVALGYAMLSRKVPDELHGQSGENPLKYIT